MMNEELQERARQVILATIQEIDKRTVWDLIRCGEVDSLGEDRDASRVADLAHRARVTIEF